MQINIIANPENIEKKSTNEISFTSKKFEQNNNTIVYSTNMIETKSSTDRYLNITTTTKLNLQIKKVID